MTPLGAAARVALRVLASPGAVVLIDGRSGAGKSVLGERLAAAAGAALLRLDDLYPGWDGLDAGADAAARALGGRRAGAPVAVRRWDWEEGRPGGRLPIAPAGPLVVEGCGAIRPASLATADLALWLDVDTATRRTRAMLRDGEAYRPHWHRWARQEALALVRDRPRSLADLVVDGRTLRIDDQ